MKALPSLFIATCEHIEFNGDYNNRIFLGQIMECDMCGKRPSRYPDGIVKAQWQKDLA